MSRRDEAMKNFALLKESSPFYDLFDGGAVPILNIAVPSSVALEGSDETQAYMVDLAKVPAPVVREICCRLAHRAGANAASVIEEVMARGLPLRASQVRCVTTDVPFFL